MHLADPKESHCLLWRMVLSTFGRYCPYRNHPSCQLTCFPTVQVYPTEHSCSLTNMTTIVLKLRAQCSSCYFKEANLRKLDTRRTIWISNKETPHYTSKAIRRQNNRPFGRSIDRSLRVALAVKPAYRNVSQHCIYVVFEQRKDPSLVFDRIQDKEESNRSP